MRRQLAPGKPVARRFQRHLANRVNFFQQRLSSGRIEGLHNKIQSLVKKPVEIVTPNDSRPPFSSISAAATATPFPNENPNAKLPKPQKGAKGANLSGFGLVRPHTHLVNGQ